MKRLVMCEGDNELAVINILLDLGEFKFPKSELLDDRAFHARQLSKNSDVEMAIRASDEDGIIIMRIGDTLTDRLNISKYDKKISKVEKYCTKPELEILLIINEGLYSEFQKVKSDMSPKEFAKKNIFYPNGRRKYDGQTRFYNEYFGSDPEALARAIKEYKLKNGSHDKDELYLADLLK